MFKLRNSKHPKKGKSTCVLGWMCACARAGALARCDIGCSSVLAVVEIMGGLAESRKSCTCERVEYLQNGKKKGNIEKETPDKSGQASFEKQLT